MKPIFIPPGCQLNRRIDRVGVDVLGCPNAAAEFGNKVRPVVDELGIGSISNFEHAPAMRIMKNPKLLTVRRTVVYSHDSIPRVIAIFVQTVPDQIPVLIVDETYPVNSVILVKVVNRIGRDPSCQALLKAVASGIQYPSVGP